MKTLIRARTMVVIVYDITDDRRRAQVRRFLLEYGIPVQESAFECFLSTAEMATLRNAIRDRVDTSDSVRYYPLCRACRDQAAAANGGTKEVGRTVIV